MTAAQRDFTETTIRSRTVYRGALLELLEDEVALPDGRHARREYVRHPGAVLMLPFVDAATLLLVRQFRYPLGRHFVELPAGKIDAGEQPLATAQRELAEECGLEARSWRHLGTLHPCVGYSDERIELFLARELEPARGRRDAEEFLEVVRAPLAQALEWVRAGAITDAKTVAGLLWAERIAAARW